jgi:hypothetical protein
MPSRRRRGCLIGHTFNSSLPLMFSCRSRNSTAIRIRPITRFTVSVSAPIWPSPLRRSWIAMTPPKVPRRSTRPAGQLGAAKHHGGDHPELVQLAVIGVHRAAFGIEHHRRERRQKPDDHEVDHHVRPDADAGVDRRLAVVADGIGVAAMHRAVHQKPHRRSVTRAGTTVAVCRPRNCASAKSTSVQFRWLGRLLAVDT